MNRYKLTIFNKDINGQYDRKFVTETNKPLWAIVQDISSKYYNGQYILYSLDHIDYNIYELKEA